MKILTIFSLFLVFITQGFSSSLGFKSFETTFKSSLGVYKLEKNSHRNCSDGQLRAIKDDFKNGFRLGQSIYFGPFDELSQVEKLRSGCKMTTHFIFSKNSIKERTLYENCKEQTGKIKTASEKQLIIDKKLIHYQVKDSDYKCHFKRIRK